MDFFLLASVGTLRSFFLMLPVFCISSRPLTPCPDLSPPHSDYLTEHKHGAQIQAVAILLHRLPVVVFLPFTSISLILVNITISRYRDIANLQHQTCSANIYIGNHLKTIPEPHTTSRTTRNRQQNSLEHLRTTFNYHQNVYFKEL